VRDLTSGTIQRDIRPQRLAIASAALVIVLLHIPLSLRFPETAGITPIAWGLLSALALSQVIGLIRRSPTGMRWKWTLVSLHFVFSIASLFCILYAEYVTPGSQPALWLNDIFRSWKLIALLLAVCSPEKTESSFNRVFDALQAILIALMFFILFSPDLSHITNFVIVKPDANLVNQYDDGLAILLVVITLIAVFTARTADSRFFHTVLAICLCVAVPGSIYTNELVNNLWVLPPASVHHIVGDLGPIALIFASILLPRRLKPREPGHILIFLRLGASVFLPLFGLLASMLLAVTGRHVVTAVAGAITSLAVYGIRSTYGQFQLLDIQKDLQSSNQRLEVLSVRDPLTSLYNRRWFDEHFALECKRAQRAKSPISLLIIDIDHFKLYNDTHGHAQGDQCLQSVATLMLKQVARATDALVRYGGEEFLAMLPNTPAEGAMQIAEAIQSDLEANVIPHTACQLKRLTLSIGVATAYPHAEDPDCTNLLLQADDALYKAKAQGRNRIHKA
jgi:diguanylate cyclase (GGDEF)-like protein